MSSQPGLGMSPRRGRVFAFLLIVFDGIDFTDLAGHAKIGDFTDTHFVDQHILQLDVSVDVAHGVVDVLESSDDLPEHRAYVIVWEGGAAVALKDVVQGAGGAVLSDEVIGVGSMIELEQRKNVFVMK